MMRKVYFLFAGIIGIIVIITGGILIFRNSGRYNVRYTGYPIHYKQTPAKVSMADKSLSGRKIAMVIAFKDFRDQEYFVPKEIWEKAGAEIKVVSNQIGQALGADGGEANVDLLVSEINPADFDAVVFIGGPGCLANLDNESSYNLVKETTAKNKLLAAICASPVVLAKAGVLNGKSATVWSSALDKSAIKILEQNGANYQPRDVVVDGRIITANGPDAARRFADTLIENLK